MKFDITSYHMTYDVHENRYHIISYHHISYDIYEGHACHPWRSYDHIAVNMPDITV